MGDDGAQRELSGTEDSFRLGGQRTRGKPRYQVGKDFDLITHPCQSAQRPGQPICAMAPLERAVVTGTRSAESIMVSGHVKCRVKRPDTWQSRPAVQKKIRNPLPTGGHPHMALFARLLVLPVASGAAGHSCRCRCASLMAVMASSPGEFHPQALQEPCVNLSAYTAHDVQPLAYMKRQWAKRLGLARRTRANQAIAHFGRRCRRLNLRSAQRTR